MRILISMRSPGLKPTVGLSVLCAIACGGVRAPSDVDRIRAAAARDFECSVEDVGLSHVGDGETTAGEAVPVYHVAGCMRAGRYFCDTDGCQRDGAVEFCNDLTSSMDRLHDPGDYSPLSREERQRRGRYYEFEDPCSASVQ